MNLKKAISYAAFGFFFILVNINLTLSGGTINITPNFVGWILMFLAFVPFGTYMEGKTYMHWLPLVMAVFTGALWLLSIAEPGMENPLLSVLQAVLNIVELVYMFTLFGILEKVADDCGSSKSSSLRMIKLLMLVLYLVVTVFALLTRYTESTALAAVVLVCGMALLVLMIIALFVLFGLRKEIRSQE